MGPLFKKQPKGFATKAIHAGQNPSQWNSRSVVPPISLSTTFKQHGPGEHEGYEYSRSGNPTRNVLENCLAALDDAKYSLTFSSGLGTAMAVFSMLSAGDHIIIGDDVYGGTARLVRQVISRLGIQFSFIDPTDLPAFESAIQSNTKLVWIETPTNPLIKVADIDAISKFCQNKNVIFAVDNTFLTSYFQRPLELGADLVCYSLTKYMNGHSDVVMGCITTNSEDLYQKLKFLQNATGIVPSPFDCYQVNRGLKTLPLRMEQHQKSSIAVAKFLEEHPFVQKVLHPALPSHPQHQLSLKQTYGYSGVFSFFLKGDLKHSRAFLQNLKLFALAESLGGYESLAELPSIMTHASVPAEERKKLGISDSLIRLSIGLEETEDLIGDLENALKISMAL
ncbi:cystathionine gamma-lyase [Bactrocera neohumeralis]|uniref:cystathionine gamma-lyase n=1 Tax=Bactrocera tryoni TaxID=59916 RepID=UPI001A98A364|nr:cystathionine gamma-lyase [Bactrocera tryoni]XP_050331587.1 cystathionine gamma-lyase [Bactrocera neohumeralis]